MSARVEAAAKAAAKDEDASNWYDEHEYYRNGWRNRMDVGLAAADAVMFDAEAIERAAQALHAETGLHWDAIPEDVRQARRDTVRAVIAALKGDDA